jgi:hypothetical protein
MESFKTLNALIIKIEGLKLSPTFKDNRMKRKKNAKKIWKVSEVMTHEGHNYQN